MSDDEVKDTQVVPKEAVGFTDEGTEEMDRAALLARLQGDSGARAKEPKPARDSSHLIAPRHATEQQPAVSEKTIATTQSTKAPDPTQHYIVPDSLLKQTRDTQVETVEVPLTSLPKYEEDADDDLPTTTFSMDSFLEFEAVVDQHGRVALPESAVRGKFKHGARLKVVIYALE